MMMLKSCSLLMMLIVTYNTLSMQWGGQLYKDKFIPIELWFFIDACAGIESDN